MYIPNRMNATSSRYSQGYGMTPSRSIRMTGSCCPTRSCRCGRYENCRCGAGQPGHYASTPGAASGQAATMMMPNIVINVQSGNRKSNDLSYEHGDYYGPRYADPQNETTTETEVLPVILSPRVKKKAEQAFVPGVPPEYVGRRYPLEFP